MKRRVYDFQDEYGRRDDQDPGGPYVEIHRERKWKHITTFILVAIISITISFLSALFQY